MEREQIIRDECKNKGMYALGTAYVYSRRMINLERWLSFNTVLGILIPSLVGGMVLNYGTDIHLSNLIIVAGPFSMFQLILSIIIVTYKLEDRKTYYLESSVSNRKIGEDYNSLLLRDNISDLDTPHLLDSNR